MRQRASPFDKQSEARTKVPDEVWDKIEAYANARQITAYEAIRRLIIIGLDAEHPDTN